MDKNKLLNMRDESKIPPNTEEVFNLKVLSLTLENFNIYEKINPPVFGHMEIRPSYQNLKA